MIEVACQQGEEAWLLARRGIPTASEFGRFITPSANRMWPPPKTKRKPKDGEEPKAKSPLSDAADLYIAELIDEVMRPDAQVQWGGNRHTDRGRELEPAAVDWYTFATGREVRACGLLLADDRQSGCSPDSLVTVRGLLDRGLEAKAPEGKKHVLWRLAGALPDEHKAQVHGGMVVTGLRRWDFLSYCDGYEPFLIEVEWDGYTDLLAQARDEFCDRLAAAKAEFLEPA